MQVWRAWRVLCGLIRALVLLCGGLMVTCELFRVQTSYHLFSVWQKKKKVYCLCRFLCVLSSSKDCHFFLVWSLHFYLFIYLFIFLRSFPGRRFPSCINISLYSWEREVGYSVDIIAPSTPASMHLLPPKPKLVKSFGSKLQHFYKIFIHARHWFLEEFVYAIRDLSCSGCSRVTRNTLGRLVSKSCIVHRDLVYYP